ncbi:MAG: phosphodiesterase [Thermomicrobiales bacterium]
MAGPDAPTLADLAEVARAGGGPLALNVKADGLASAVAPLIAPVRERCFFFDMSVPDMRSWFAQGLPVFTRHSDVETHPVYYAEAAGVWMDEMLGAWITERVILDHLANGKRVGLISSELYGRPPERLWEIARLVGSPDVMVCTDLVAECQRFLRGGGA